MFNLLSFLGGRGGMQRGYGSGFGGGLWGRRMGWGSLAYLGWRNRHRIQGLFQKGFSRRGMTNSSTGNLRNIRDVNSDVVHNDVGEMDRMDRKFG